MIRGGDFYAIWIEERGLWSTEEEDALQLIDSALDRYTEEHKKSFESSVKVLHMWDGETGMIDIWHHFCQRQMRDSFKMLDEKLIFSNMKTTKKDYASKRLNYPLEEGLSPSYDKLISTLYDDEERHKLEWAIGAVVCGESKKLQKFLVLYGSMGTGKSTILNIVQALFEGYYAPFDAKALGSSNNAFALEAFKTNPMVAIQHDGDLSKIEDNTRLNSLVSHEMMTVNEKFKPGYANKFKCFLFMGTNKPVKITDAKSGLIRRLIDVSPSGNKIPAMEYKKLVKQTDFELGAIAWHCQQVYLDDPLYYDEYVPIKMLGASNDFYNFIIDSYQILRTEDGVTLKAAWEMYKTYCDEAKVSFPFSQRIFKEELKNYFRDYKERFNLDDGTRVRSYYEGFRTEKFEDQSPEKKVEPVAKPKPETLELNSTVSIFDKECADYIAQYATKNDTPCKSWDKVTSKLSDLDTSRVHYVKVPENHIVIDLDITDESGNKSLEKNMEEAKKWPPTYAELSKSGKAVHLHYIYNGDVTKLSRVYDDHIEVKVYTGGSALRRRLSRCNDLPIASISSGLPLKGDAKVVNFEGLKSEQALRTVIKRNLNKEYHPGTASSVSFIKKSLDDAYKSGLKYDVSDMQNAILAFAANSTNQASTCLKMVKEMKFRSDEPSESFPFNVIDVRTDDLIFYDVEVFPNLFVVNWKVRGKDKSVVRMINPKPEDIEKLLRFKLVGFNCRRYDNHIMYARLIGYANMQLYELSQKIVSGDRHCFFGEAYNLSYTDVYDFASAPNKMSLKKYEIKLGLHHHELGLAWDQPVPEELWPTVAEYCDDDVIATEATFDYLESDWTARQILADIAGLSVNDTTNTCTTRIVFGTNKKPQSAFNYRNLAEPVRWSSDMPRKYGPDKVYRIFDENGDPTYETYIPGSDLPEGYSIMPFFPGYEFKFGKSTYMDQEIGEGGRVYSEPGMYGNAALLDIASQHPTSAIEEMLWGPVYTPRYADIKNSRVYIKHHDFDSAKKVLDGKLAKFLDSGAFTADDLGNALKTPINSAYGLTAAKFENAFRDPRNVDNIMAKRGALFMTKLKTEVQKRGFIVAHIKTDSIKIPDATPEIIQFVMDYGKEFGYVFEHEATYDKICLVNDAVYIAKYDDKGIRTKGGKHPNEWTATGTQFAVPYVFKKLFSKESIVFDDLCETKSVTSSMYLDMNENLPDVSEYENELIKLQKTDLTSPKIERLKEEITKGHDYHFVGKVGQFCPIRPGFGGGLLMRESINSKTGEKGYAATTGSKGYRWMESEMVKQLGKEDTVDRAYYAQMVDTAAKAIDQYGLIDWFISDKPYDREDNEILPF